MSSFELIQDVSGYIFYLIGIIAFVLLCLKLHTRVTLNMCTCDTSMSGKTVIITGANRGIGKETALELAKHGAKIIMGCRSLEKGERAAKEIIELSGNDNIIVKQLDLCSFESVRNFANTILRTEEKIDVLVNNAGLLGPAKRETTNDGCELIMQSNHLSHFLLTNLLLDLLKRSAPCRIITVSSVMYMFSFLRSNDLQHQNAFYNKWFVYSNSKMANILFTQELSRRLEGTGVTANCLHPGAVSTGFLRDVHGFQATMTYFFLYFVKKNAMEGAQTSIHLALAPELEKTSGKYFSECNEAELNRRTTVSEAKKLWTISERIVGLNNE